MKNYVKTRMTTFIKTKFKISDDQTNIDKYRLSVKITDYYIISKCQKSSCLKWTYGLFGHNYRVATLFTL